MTVHPDRQLVDKLIAGDEDAFDAFFRSYFPRLFRFVMRRVDDDDALAADVVQATLCRAVRKLGSYRGEAALFTWLCQACRNEISEHFRRRQREVRRVVPMEDDPAVRAALESLEGADAHDPLRGARNSELAGLVQVTLDYLPVNYGNALEWKYIQGHSVKEIADRLGVSREAAQSLLARARRAFRDAFSTLVRGQIQLLLD